MWRCSRSFLVPPQNNIFFSYVQASTFHPTTNKEQQEEQQPHPSSVPDISSISLHLFCFKGIFKKEKKSNVTENMGRNKFEKDQYVHGMMTMTTIMRHRRKSLRMKMTERRSTLVKKTTKKRKGKRKDLQSTRVKTKKRRMTPNTRRRCTVASKRG